MNSFRQSMTWLHTWFGLVMCWIMYFMFVTGTLGYFDTEIDHWMKPEVSISEKISLKESLKIAEKHLNENAQGAEHWFIGPVNDRQNTNVNVFWSWPDDFDKPSVDRQLDSVTGLPVGETARETGGGQVLYRMHYLLHYIDEDVIYPIMGVITLLMFIGVITGIVIHKKIFKELFTFRPNKRSRSWLDMHNLLSVSSLPFQIMITYSGLLFMVTTFFPIIAFGGLGFDQELAKKELPKILGRGEHPEYAHKAAPLIPLETIADKLEGVNVNEIRSILIDLPGDANAQITVTLMKGVSSRGADPVKIHGVTGEILTDENHMHSSAMDISSVFIGLHEGLFAGPVLRWLYFIAGIIGSGMIATGAIYWVIKRRKKNEQEGGSFGFSLVENLNIGTIVGLLSAIGFYFLSNRLLPLDIENRGDWEVHSMFLTWLVCLIHPFLRDDKQQAWIEQCYLVAIIFFAIPVVNYLTTDAHLLNSLANGNWILAGFDLTFIGMALAILFAIKKLKAKQVGKSVVVEAELVTG